MELTAYQRNFKGFVLNIPEDADSIVVCDNICMVHRVPGDEDVYPYVIFREWLVFDGDLIVVFDNDIVEVVDSSHIVDECMGYRELKNEPK